MEKRSNYATEITEGEGGHIFSRTSVKGDSRHKLLRNRRPLSTIREGTQNGIRRHTASPIRRRGEIWEGVFCFVAGTDLGLLFTPIPGQK